MRAFDGFLAVSILTVTIHITDQRPISSAEQNVTTTTERSIVIDGVKFSFRLEAPQNLTMEGIPKFPEPESDLPTEQKAKFWAIFVLVSGVLFLPLHIAAVCALEKWKRARMGDSLYHELAVSQSKEKMNSLDPRLALVNDQ